MLTINIIEKKFAKRIILEKINLTIKNYGLYGIVGKNGQGKTTLFRCVLGLENYIGESYFNNSKITLHNIAWSPTEPSIYGELTAKEFYEFYKNLLDLNEVTNIPLFEVPQNTLIREFSTGMKKKAYLNAVFQKNYPIYFLDEPFNGLDLEANYILVKYLKEKSKESIVFISSHIMDILYNNCQLIFLLNNKKMMEFEKKNFIEIQNIIFES